MHFFKSQVHIYWYVQKYAILMVILTICNRLEVWMENFIKKTSLILYIVMATLYRLMYLMEIKVLNRSMLIRPVC